jgi:flagellar motility protein MotE (MotC chaperone)
MIRLVRDLRFVPLVLVATISLFALKTLGLVFDGGYMLNELAVRGADDVDITGSTGAKRRPDPLPADDLMAAPPAPAPAPSRQSWAHEMFNFPDVTGAITENKPAETPPAKADRTATAKPEQPPPAGTQVPLERTLSSAERAILERLSERRVELDARARELDMRESLIKAAEKRLEARITELKEIEARITNAAHQKDEGEAAKFKNLVSMYDNMKAKDAAKIFDRLDMRVLAEVARQINPRRMSDILAQMSTEAAERLTVELAARAKDKDKPGDLPKIEGRPMTN